MEQFICVHAELHVRHRACRALLWRGHSPHQLLQLQRSRPEPHHEPLLWLLRNRGALSARQGPSAVAAPRLPRDGALLCPLLLSPGEPILCLPVATGEPVLCLSVAIALTKPERSNRANGKGPFSERRGKSALTTRAVRAGDCTARVHIAAPATIPALWVSCLPC